MGFSLAWSLDRFHTPLTVFMTVSCGRTRSRFSDRMAPRSFSSRYILDEA